MHDKEAAHSRGEHLIQLLLSFDGDNKYMRITLL
jgi:hypothetical protein